jgi:hypothetical protein
VIRGDHAEVGLIIISIGSVHRGIHCDLHFIQNIDTSHQGCGRRRILFVHLIVVAMERVVIEGIQKYHDRYLSRAEPKASRSLHCNLQSSFLEKPCSPPRASGIPRGRTIPSTGRLSDGREAVEDGAPRKYAGELQGWHQTK